MGGKIKIKKLKNSCGEDVGNINAEYSRLKGVVINSKLSPFLIDEYPILSIAASQARGKTIMKGLAELRHKESDRIKSIVINLKKLNINVTQVKDNIEIYGKKINLKKNKTIKTFGDHRIAMSFSILNLICDNMLLIDDVNCISISYPKFKNHLDKLLN